MKKRCLAAAVLALLVLAGGCGTSAGTTAPASGSPDVSAAVLSAAPAPSASPTESAGEPAETAAPAAKAVSSAPPAVSASVTKAPAGTETPSSSPEKETELTCTLWVRCDTVLDHLDRLDPDKAELVPEDGVLLHAEKVPFTEGETVFDVLLRVTRQKKVQMEFVDTPLYHSAYVEGIGNLYEFDCGELSGWSFKVNGVFPGEGCSLYKLKDGDTVEWVYTCDMGRDVGGGNSLEGS